MSVEQTNIRLAVMIPTLAGGGMERVHIYLIEAFRQKGFEVDLLVSQFKGPLCRDLPESVRVFELARHSSYWLPVGLWRYLRRRKPTHILAAPNDIALVALWVTRRLRLTTPIVMSVHNHISTQQQFTGIFKRLKERLVMSLLRRYCTDLRAVIAVSKGVAQDFSRYLPVSRERLHVVYNPVVTPQTQELLAEDLPIQDIPDDRPWVVFAGRFVKLKGLDILLPAFAQVVKQVQARLVLLGDGPLISVIDKMISDYDLHACVHCPGFQANPLPWMNKAAVLVLSSRTEGLPGVLIEAMAAGTQIVATDCPSGPAEILEEGRYGQLVPVGDIDALGNAIVKSLKGEFFVPPEQLKAHAEDFTVDKAANAYLELLLSVPNHQ